jgi:hypothetical protein
MTGLEVKDIGRIVLYNEAGQSRAGILEELTGQTCRVLFFHTNRAETVPCDQVEVVSYAALDQFFGKKPSSVNPTPRPPPVPSAVPTRMKRIRSWFGQLLFPGWSDIVRTARPSDVVRTARPSDDD